VTLRALTLNLLARALGTAVDVLAGRKEAPKRPGESAP